VHWAAISVQLVLPFVVLRVLMLVLLNTSVTGFYAQPPPSSPGQLELLKLSFFPPYLPLPPAWESLRMQRATLWLGPAALAGRLSMPGSQEHAVRSRDCVPAPI